MYTIDLATILQLLREFRRSGILRTEISSGLPRLKKPCFVVIELRRGEVTLCHVKDTKGQTLLSGQEAFRAISAAGKLNWVFDAVLEQELPGGQQRKQEFPGQAAPTSHLNSGFHQTSPSLPVPQWPVKFSQRSLVPQRLIALGYADINGWPRRHRQVYVLIDGVRSVEKIAAMLSQPSQLVEEVLREIQATGAIILQEM